MSLTYSQSKQELKLIRRTKFYFLLRKRGEIFVEHDSLIKLAKCILNVFSVQCEHCAYQFDYIIESADTDMLSCYCDSAYSADEDQLVIAEITMDEYRYGAAGRLDLRINTLLAKQDFHCCTYRESEDVNGHKRYKMICPCCSKSLSEKRQGISLDDYCKFHPYTLIIYSDGTIRTLKTELSKSALSI